MDKGTVIFTDRFAETARGNSQWWQHVPIRKLVETTRYAIFTQAYSRVTFLCEPCPALLTTSRSSLACLKKAQRLSRISRCRYHRQAATYLASKIECYAMNAWLRKCTQDLLVWSDHMRFGKLRVKQIPSDSSVITVIPLFFDAICRQVGDSYPQRKSHRWLETIYFTTFCKFPVRSHSIKIYIQEGIFLRILSNLFTRSILRYIPSSVVNPFFGTVFQ